jgi:hypothetical protein
MPRWARFNVIIGILQQSQDNILNVLTNIPRLGEGRGVSDGEGDIQYFCQGAGQERLA